MKKKKELKMEILQNYFSFHGDIATLELVYDTFSELINPNFGDDKIEKLDEKLLSDVREAVSLLPKKFKLDLHIVIKDFGDYTKEECERIIRQNIYLAAYRTVKDNKRKLISGWSLIGTGAVMLIVSYLLHNYELWFDLINISGTLFVWEGVNMAFLERSLENREIRALARSVRNITIEGETAAATDNVPEKREELALPTQKEGAESVLSAPAESETPAPDDTPRETAET